MYIFLLLIFILPSQITRSSQTVCCCYKNMNEHLSTDKTQLLHVKNVFSTCILSLIRQYSQTFRRVVYVKAISYKENNSKIWQSISIIRVNVLSINCRYVLQSLISKVQLNAYALKLHKDFWYLCSVLPSTNLHLSKRIMQF